VLAQVPSLNEAVGVVLVVLGVAARRDRPAAETDEG
jgi:hypothetical protein